MHMVSALRRAALIRARGPAIASHGTRRSWQDTLERVSRRASALSDAGLVPGTHVATLALNSPAYFECLLAIWWAGGVVVPINTRLAYEEIRHILQHGEVRLFVTDENFTSVGQRAIGDIPGLTLRYLEEDLQGGSMQAVSTSSEALAGIFYTGGTTGLPKGVELTHGSFLFSALTLQREMVLDEDAVYLHATPLFHLADFSIGLAVMLGAGAHSFMPQFSAAAFYERLRNDGVTHLNLVPTMLAMILEAPERDDSLLARIRCVAYGAAPISESLLMRLIQAMPSARIQQFYGMTESCGASATLSPAWHTLDGARAGRLRAAGQPVAGVEIRIVDSLLKEVGLEEAGEILMRGPNVMRGYWRDAGRTTETVVDGWLRSGDIGRMDRDGLLYVVDRLKDMIISGGENIYCAEVENALATHPDVAACAVLGVPDERWGERVHAVVVPRADAELSEKMLDAHCRALIAAYKVPRSYEMRAHPLPLSAVGKVQKNRLRDEWDKARKEAPQ